MTSPKTEMRRAAELLEQSAGELRRLVLQWDGNAYVWPRSAAQTKRLHNKQLDQAIRLRKVVR